MTHNLSPADLAAIVNLMYSADCVHCGRDGDSNDFDRLARAANAVRVIVDRVEVEAARTDEDMEKRMADAAINAAALRLNLSAESIREIYDSIAPWDAETVEELADDLVMAYGDLAPTN